ncbi:hypothetical protein [Streptomyces wuyuanensis]|uniref:DUF3168 domain-containing protein n=1 Tax=Streptomyces wuyuanensis TaxID=1196353 RepID=A0A1G9Z917_9ACTN|nr:hypothetical protein [Streptomyces wuyuanensis]SDN17820.1 hypothetical protein SAMN05444921_12124 [Streptomyces wuyuanensis]
MATSAIPGAIDALLTVLRAAPDLADVQVLDGPPVGDQSAQDYVAVGYQEGAEESVQMAQDFNAAGARTRDEDFDILCWIDTWTGDSDVSARRTRAFELLAVVEDAIRASGVSPTAPTLNGAVLWAHLTNASLRQANTTDGVRAVIAFSVSCRARI